MRRGPVPLAFVLLGLLVGCGGDEQAATPRGGGPGRGGPPPPAAGYAPAPPPSGGGGGGVSGGDGDMSGGWASAARAAGHGGGLGSQIFAHDEAHRQARVGPERLDGHDREDDEASRLHVALSSTTAVVDPEDDECEQHFERLQAGLDAFAREHATDGTPEDRPPAIAAGRADYLRTCRARPAAEQHCLTPAYRTAHAETCQRLSDARVSEGEALARRARRGQPVATGVDPHAHDPVPTPPPHDDLLPDLPR